MGFGFFLYGIREIINFVDDSTRLYVGILRFGYALIALLSAALFTRRAQQRNARAQMNGIRPHISMANGPSGGDEATDAELNFERYLQLGVFFLAGTINSILPAISQNGPPARHSRGLPHGALAYARMHHASHHAAYPMCVRMTGTSAALPPPGSLFVHGATTGRTYLSIGGLLRPVLLQAHTRYGRVSSAW